MHVCSIYEVLFHTLLYRYLQINYLNIQYSYFVGKQNKPKLIRFFCGKSNNIIYIGFCLVSLSWKQKMNIPKGMEFTWQENGK